MMLHRTTDYESLQMIHITCQHYDHLYLLVDNEGQLQLRLLPNEELVAHVSEDANIL